ncbi:MAG TPA: chromosomal replication initiator protein DnaA, partial [Ilumatobacteraceae bacterium]|nr:chromosomal replication initiator protein DnaA [Ilumatobacteraceae bacterium]
MTDSADVWTQVTLSLRSQLAESVWFSTFQDVAPLPSDNDTLRLLAPSAYVRDRIMSRYLPLVTEALQDVNEGHRTVEIDVDTAGDISAISDIAASPDGFAAASPLDDGADTSGGRAPSSGNDPRYESTRSLLVDEAGLNPRYTFETFVKGASNQFALAAALRVAETPARSYNPLFIYGSAGLGKTHLLHAIGHYVHSNYQHHEVRYVSTETFMNEYVDAIRQNTTNSLRRRYRDIDVLLIDDIQFIAGKEGLQEEFFHTFNSLHGANKQVVISSDRMPDAIPTLEERLRGRFKWGLITDIQPPDLETRLAILRNKSERDRVLVPDETLEFIATNIATNIRELEGALIRVTAFASLNQVPITTDLAQTQLADLLVDSKPKARTDDELLADIAAILKFPVEDLKGRSRQRPLVTARQIAMYVFRELTDLSYPAIARLFGG